MANVRGIFRWNQVTDEQLSGTWPLVGGDGLNGAPDTGYLGGGNAPAANSRIERIDFSNDTAGSLVRGKLSRNRRLHGAVGSPTHGYFSGGVPGINSINDRIDYSNDSVQVTTIQNLTAVRYACANVGTTQFGYVSGGLTPSNSSSIDRIDYSNDDVSRFGQMSLPRYYHGAVGNNNYAYFINGLTPGNSSRVDRLDYANETTAPFRMYTTLARYWGAAVGNNDYGYYGGGTPGPRSIIDRIEYANDLGTTPTRGPLATAVTNVATTGNAYFGYWAGGSTTSWMQRLDYSNDTATTSPRGNLALPNEMAAGLSGRANGSPAFGISTPVRYFGVKTVGYWGGGNPASPTVASSIERLNFSNDTVNAVFKGNLNSPRLRPAGHSSQTHGYYATGRDPSTSPVDISTVNRLDYVNDTANTLIRGPVSLARDAVAGVSNPSYGWTVGGWRSAISASTGQVDRIDFSNDTATALVRGSYGGGYGAAGAGNSNYGWISGGNVPPIYRDVRRIDYSNDTPSTAYRMLLSVARFYHAATGNANYGYHGGGTTPAVISTIDRVDYSNDTGTAPAKGPLVGATAYMTATGNNDYGYFGGGSPNANGGTKIQRIDFSNDTATALYRGNLGRLRQGSGAHSAGANGQDT